MAISALEMRLRELAETQLGKAFSLNLDLAEHPEISGAEYESVKRITELLEEEGIPCEIGVCGFPTAFKGIVKEDPSSPIRIAIITEYDALPGIGHACGHSASAAASVLSAIALKRCGEDFPGSIDIIGTPDEENIGLKIPMAEAGYFDDYDFAIMVHMDSNYKHNWKLFAFETYDFIFTGKTAHAAASPWAGKNAVDGMLLMIHAFEMMRQKLRDGSRVEGIIKEGGLVSNIIPDRAVCQYTFRAGSINYLREEVLPMVFDAAKGCALATQTEVQILPYGNPFYDMKPIPTGEHTLLEIFADYDFPNDTSGQVMGSSDMGNLSYHCPAFHPSVPITEDISLHTVEFAEAVKSPKTKGAILDGATIILAMIARAVENQDWIDQIAIEFKG
ncbi:MAG: peptidase dimerization domain-containing protein [Tissierellia bacterium]|nr:peptidase dimerization domain-containing protein [Tissierellia bacterium]